MHFHFFITVYVYTGMCTFVSSLQIIDHKGKPSLIRCEPHLNFNGCAYFILITVSLVGFSSPDSSSAYSKALVVVLIFIALFTLPGQFQDIEHLVNSRSQFNNPYKPYSKGENHVIVCGHVNDKQKLSAFLQEFLHPDRMFSNSVLFHVVILHTDEPRSVPSQYSYFSSCLADAARMFRNNEHVVFLIYLCFMCMHILYCSCVILCLM